MKDVLLKLLDVVNNHFKFIVAVVLLGLLGFFTWLSNDQIYEIVLTVIKKVPW